MQNPIFTKAMVTASGLLGRRDRIARLLSQLAITFAFTDRKQLRVEAIKKQSDDLARMVKAYASGRYRNVAWKSVALVLGAFVYLVNPFDLVPDVAPVIGFTDDFSILVWVYTSIQQELDGFLAWEKLQQN